MRPAIAVLDDYADAALRLADWSEIGARADLTILPGPLASESLPRVLAPFDILCLTRERTAFPASLMSKLPRLRAIITTGKTTANLDSKAARAAGVEVIAAPLVYSAAATEAIAELAIGLMISLARKIDEGSRLIAAGKWQQEPGRSLRGQTLGLLGLGRTGSAMVPLARALGMDVIAWSPRLSRDRAAMLGARLVSRDHLLSHADVLSLHMPAGPDTDGSFGRREFALMKRRALLINTSRASLIEESALIGALTNGRIAGAALDVLPVEPLSPDSRLRMAPNLLMTPHLGYATEAGMAAFYKAMIAALRHLV